MNSIDRAKLATFLDFEACNDYYMYLQDNRRFRFCPICQFEPDKNSAQSNLLRLRLAELDYAYSGGYFRKEYQVSSGISISSEKYQFIITTKNDKVFIGEDLVSEDTAICEAVLCLVDYLELKKYVYVH